MFLCQSLSPNLFHKHKSWIDSFRYCFKCGKKSPQGCKEQRATCEAALWVTRGDCFIQWHQPKWPYCLQGLQRGQSATGSQSPGLLEVPPVVHGFPFPSCCLGNWRSIYFEIFLYIYCFVKAIRPTRKLVAKCSIKPSLVSGKGWCIIKITV